jgi:hypothetical protein
LSDQSVECEQSPAQIVAQENIASMMQAIWVMKRIMKKEQEDCIVHHNLKCSRHPTFGVRLRNGSMDEFCLVDGRPRGSVTLTGAGAESARFRPPLLLPFILMELRNRPMNDGALRAAAAAVRSCGGGGCCCDCEVGNFAPREWD